LIFGAVVPECYDLVDHGFEVFRGLVKACCLHVVEQVEQMPLFDGLEGVSIHERCKDLVVFALVDFSGELSTHQFLEMGGVRHAQTERVSHKLGVVTEEVSGVGAFAFERELVD